MWWYPIHHAPHKKPRTPWYHGQSAWCNSSRGWNLYQPESEPAPRADSTNLLNPEFQVVSDPFFLHSFTLSFFCCYLYVLVSRIAPFHPYRAGIQHYILTLAMNALPPSKAQYVDYDHSRYTQLGGYVFPLYHDSTPISPPTISPSNSPPSSSHSSPRATPFVVDTDPSYKMYSNHYDPYQLAGGIQGPLDWAQQRKLSEDYYFEVQQAKETELKKKRAMWEYMREGDTSAGEFDARHQIKASSSGFLHVPSGCGSGSGSGSGSVGQGQGYVESNATVQLKGKNKCRSQLENGKAHMDQMESVQEKMKGLHVSHSNSVSSDKRPAYITNDFFQTDIPLVKE